MNVRVYNQWLLKSLYSAYYLEISIMIVSLRSSYILLLLVLLECARTDNSFYHFKA